MLKNNVLRKNKDFSDIYKKGKSAGDKFTAPTDLAITEQGF